MADDDELLNAVMAVVPPVLTALDVLARAARHLHPTDLEDIVAAMAPFRAPVAQGLAAFDAVAWPDHLGGFASAVRATADNVLKGLDGITAAPTHTNPLMAAYSALRYQSRALEGLYPLTAMLPPVSRYFLDDPQRDDGDLLDRLAQGVGPDTGVFHVANDATERGGFSVYVPETADPGRALPVVVAMHGGSGHGRAFLWTWLRAARSQEVILISPTSRDRTWSLMGPDVDSDNLERMLDFVAGRQPIRRDRLLLTGMSDGGTFSYVSGLRENSPFTHLAPVSASFHPMLLEMTTAERIRGLPVFLVHGALDWMFPVDVARMAEQTLRAAGAAVHYEELADLSHTYPSELNAPMLRWFLADG
ncbi:MAG: phospholipase [Pseudomonadales bacterium]|nr:phospholipase [Pseudomonadales bacterium]MCP5185665.1 phospholipase [Pseudomonadales bacterium]